MWLLTEACVRGCCGVDPLRSGGMSLALHNDLYIEN